MAPQKLKLAVLASAPLLSLAFAGAAHSSTLPGAGAANRSKQLVIQGAGDGHGVGMSQEGALGYALHGYSDRAILGRYYTDTALGQAGHGAVIRVLVGDRVRRVPLERYVRGVVSAEMPASWPLAALEAQAIASRTYALTSHAGGSRFNVYADSRSQVYEGRAAETPQTNAAVAATAGQIVTYAGRPVTTYFFASSGGMTEDVQNGFPGAEAEAWLRGVVDPYDEGPLHTWTMKMSFAAAAAQLGGLVRGSLVGIEVTKRGYSPRIVSAEILGSKGRTAVSGPELAAHLGLDATWAYFSVATAHGVHAEPDASHYSRPVESPAPLTSPAPAAGGEASPPSTNDGGGAPASGSAPASVSAPGSLDGGVAWSVVEEQGGGTPSG